MAEISKFIIAMILVGVFASAFSIFMSGMATHYPITYDNASINAYNRLSDLNNLTETMESKTMDEGGIKSNSNDILGGFFSDAYRVMKISWQSVTTFKAMTDATVENTDLGAGGFPQIFRTAIIAIVIIMIIIGIIISAMLKWQV